MTHIARRFILLRGVARGQFLDRSHFDAAEPDRGNLRGQLDGLVQILRLDQKEAADLFVGFGVWPIGNGDLAVSNTNNGRCLN